MSTKIFVNLPVKDLDKSMAFFKAMGYSFNMQFTDHTAACMVISEDIYAMLLTEPKFKEFTPKQICDTSTSAEVLICLSCDSKDHVNDLMQKALSAGAAAPMPSRDYGFMFQHGFVDLDGHTWELIWMDPAAVQQ